MYSVLTTPAFPQFLLMWDTDSSSDSTRSYRPGTSYLLIADQEEFSRLEYTQGGESTDQKGESRWVT